MIKNEFEKEEKYRLFRSVQEILHPSISKKNISDYEIIMEEDILPIRVFYPKTVSYFSNIMIFIHGNGKITHCAQKYSSICKEFSKESNCLVIAIEYEEQEKQATKFYKEIYETVKYLYERLEKNNIDSKNIILIGDSTGGNIITGINYQNEGEISIEKEILLYPTLNSDYSFTKQDYISKIHKYFQRILSEEDKTSLLFKPLESPKKIIPETLMLVGKVDSLQTEAKEYAKKYPDKVHYIEIPFSSHGFLEDMDQELKKEVFEEINQFMKS